MTDKINLIDYKTGAIGSRADIIRHYSEMIRNAEINIGKTTLYGSTITEKFVVNLRKRRNELAGQLFKGV